MFELNCPDFVWASMIFQSTFSCLFEAYTNNDGLLLDYSLFIIYYAELYLQFSYDTVSLKVV